MAETADVKALKALWFKWDTFVTEAVLDGFTSLGWEEIRTPSNITKDLFLVKTPTLLITIILAYSGIILGNVIWRSISGNRTKENGGKKPDPSWLKMFIFLHNVFLVILSTYMFLETIYQSRRYGYSLWGNVYNPDETDMARIIYIFYVSKIYEFMDTIIMLIKGNVHQVSFLHVYHHASISIIWWLLAYSVPGGDAYFTCALNSFVHILMYSYYLTAAIIGKDTKKRQKYLWWGRYMTMFQMVQFVMMSFQSVYDYFFTEYPKFLAKLLFFYMQTLLILFGNFYIRKHVLRSKSKSS